MYHTLSQLLRISFLVMLSHVVEINGNVLIVLNLLMHVY